MVSPIVLHFHASSVQITLMFTSMILPHAHYRFLHLPRDRLDFFTGARPGTAPLPPAFVRRLPLFASDFPTARDPSTPFPSGHAMPTGALPLKQFAYAAQPAVADNNDNTPRTIHWPTGRTIFRTSITAVGSHAHLFAVSYTRVRYFIGMYPYANPGYVADPPFATLLPGGAYNPTPGTALPRKNGAVIAHLPLFAPDAARAAAAPALLAGLNAGPAPIRLTPTPLGPAGFDDAFHAANAHAADMPALAFFVHDAAGAGDGADRRYGAGHAWAPAAI